VPRSFGRCSSTGPIVVFTAAGGCQPLRLPERSWSSRRWQRARPRNASTSVSIFGLDRCLHHQPDAEASDLLQDRGQLPVRAEQLVDLRAQALGG